MHSSVRLGVVACLGANAMPPRAQHKELPATLCPATAPALARTCSKPNRLFLPPGGSMGALPSCAFGRPRGWSWPSYPSCLSRLVSPHPCFWVRCKLPSLTSAEGPQQAVHRIATRIWWVPPTPEGGSKLQGVAFAAGRCSSGQHAGCKPLTGRMMVFGTATQGVLQISQWRLGGHAPREPAGFGVDAAESGPGQEPACSIAGSRPATSCPGAAPQPCVGLSRGRVGSHER